MVRFKGKEITRDDVLKELERYDEEFANTNDYDSWLDTSGYTYALEYENKLYPPKYILSKLTGIDRGQFSGGDRTNNVFKGLGFAIKDKPKKIENHIKGKQKMVKDHTSLLLNTKKQIILYGPPGTGKTFNTKKISLQILENNTDI